MSLVDTYLNILDGWSDLFSQERVYQRALRQSIASLCSAGRRTLSQAICFSGLDQEDWSAEYRLHSKREWDEEELFQPMLETALEMVSEDVIGVAYDDTQLKKTGKKIRSASWQRDPLSPPFHVNFMWGIRFLQASLILPLYLKDASASPRGIPIRFSEVAPVKKPGYKATPEEQQRYQALKKVHNLSQYFVQSVHGLRKTLDDLGYGSKQLLLAVDGSFCNKVCMRLSLERVSIVARSRKDAKLCFPAPSGSRRIYSEHKFTPELVRTDEKIPWQETTIFHGGKFRQVRYKEINGVLWQRGTRTHPLKLLVVAPVPYRISTRGRKYYRQPAYLLCTNTELSARLVLQKYFDRWQIEVNFREEKDTLGVGQAQVHSEKAVSRQPAFVAASYAALLLAGHIVYGTGRSGDFVPLPKWRRNAKRASCLDLLTLMRREMANRRDIQVDLRMNSSPNAMILKAAG